MPLFMKLVSEVCLFRFVTGATRRMLLKSEVSCQFSTMQIIFLHSKRLFFLLIPYIHYMLYLDLVEVDFSWHPIQIIKITYMQYTPNFYCVDVSQMGHFNSVFTSFFKHKHLPLSPQKMGNRKCGRKKQNAFFSLLSATK